MGKHAWLAWTLGYAALNLAGPARVIVGPGPRGLGPDPPPPAFRPIPGRAVGVVRLDAGLALETERRPGPPGAAAFSRDGHGLRLFYLIAPDAPGAKTLTFLPEDPGAKPARIANLTLATAATLRPLGVSTRFCLVELTVNDGAGSGPEPTFAASKLKVLDGTPDYRLKLDEVATRLELREVERFGEPAAHRAEIQEARKGLPRSALAGGERETRRETLVNVTWLSEPQRVRLKIVVRDTEGEYRSAAGIEPKRTPPGRGGVGPKRPGARFGVEYGVELGAVYEISKTGAEVRTETIPLTRFARVIDAPGGADARY